MGWVRMESASMRKNLRRLGWAVVPVLGITLAACRNYDVKYAPFNPRQLQENERVATGAGVPRPDRQLPTTLEVDFPPRSGNGTTQPTAPATAASTQPKVPPATGPAIGNGERIVRIPLHE